MDEERRDGLPTDGQEAARLYRLAVDEYLLAKMFENGRDGVPKNDREAARLCKLAADHGHALARLLSRKWPGVAGDDLAGSAGKYLGEDDEVVKEDVDENDESYIPPTVDLAEAEFWAHRCRSDGTRTFWLSRVQAKAPTSRDGN